MKQSHNQIQFRQIRFRETRFWNDSRFGFTLVEMLVSVTLVLIIMLLLANVFGLAANTVEKQKGTAENDQQTRTFVTILKGDLCSRTFRFVYPYPANFDLTNAGGLYDAAERRGYFSISENNPDDSTDDVLSITIDYSLDSADQSCVDSLKNELYGRASLLKPSASTLTDNQYLQANHNQPEFDDGYPVNNDLGRSPYAEVIYFLRNGNLFRRVSLVRNPGDDEGDTNPALPEILGNYPGTAPNDYAPRGTGEFNRDFDYSVIYDFNHATSARPFFMTAGGSGGQALNNDSGAIDRITVPLYDPFAMPVPTSVDTALPDSLGIPHFRFGHDMTDDRGRAREYLQAYTYPDPVGSNANSGEFFGRFILQETADSGFNYPGSPDVNGSNPYSLLDYPNHSVNANTQLITPYHDENNRRGDDILLTGVLEFDIKVWDEVRREFVDLGNSGGGQYEAADNSHSAYGNCYDTWHPRMLMPPPFRPTSVGADALPGDAGVNDDGDMTPGPPPPPTDIIDELDGSETGWPGTDDEEASRLKAIQIIVRFVDPQSSLVRQVTLIESLVD
ncbi:MAG: prepilin-type N-terminal cleavage/methylation domain-containing protein [Planctomycetaceae bacterium]|nr:prepilin-type N-terminal cleavage/methylation domain-containing protein [Planctomycetaceae bacterium]